MADRLITFTDPGADVYALAVDLGTGHVWNTAGTPAFEAYNAPNYEDYAIDLTEVGATGIYALAVPALPAGIYSVVYLVIDPVTSPPTPAEGDDALDRDVFRWDGTTITSFDPAGDTVDVGLIDGTSVHNYFEEYSRGTVDMEAAASVGATTVEVDELLGAAPGDLLVFARPGTGALTTAAMITSELGGVNPVIHFAPPLDVPLESTDVIWIFVSKICMRDFAMASELAKVPRVGQTHEHELISRTTGKNSVKINEVI